MQPRRSDSEEASWKHVPHQANIGVRGIGSTTRGAVEGAGLVLTAVITDPESVTPTQAVSIACEAPDGELLQVDWLNALVHEMATHVLQADRKQGEW